MVSLVRLFVPDKKWQSNI